MFKLLKLQPWLGRRTGGKFSAKEKFLELEETNLSLYSIPVRV